MKPTKETRLICPICSEQRTYGDITEHVIDFHFGYNPPMWTCNEQCGFQTLNHYTIVTHCLLSGHPVAGVGREPEAPFLHHMADLQLSLHHFTNDVAVQTDSSQDEKIRVDEGEETMAVQTEPSKDGDSERTEDSTGQEGPMDTSEECGTENPDTFSLWDDSSISSSFRLDASVNDASKSDRNPLSQSDKQTCPIPLYKIITSRRARPGGPRGPGFLDCVKCHKVLQFQSPGIRVLSMMSHVMSPDHGWTKKSGPWQCTECPRRSTRLSRSIEHNKKEHKTVCPPSKYFKPDVPWGDFLGEITASFQTEGVDFRDQVIEYLAKKGISMPL